ncbi:MAG: hypothetical protein ACK5Q1_05990, partial [Limnobacter sp.]
MLGKTTFIKLALVAVALVAVFFMDKVIAQDTASTEYTLAQALTQQERGVLSLSQALALAE